MSDHELRQQRDGHFSTAMLMLYLDGELGVEESAVAKHLHHCWACRERLEWINRGVLTFLDYYRHVLAAGLETTEQPPTTGLQTLRSELAKPIDTGKLRAFGRTLVHTIRRVPVPAWVTTIASLTAFFVLPYLSFVEPARLTAKDFLQRVCTVSAQRGKKTNFSTDRLVRIRRGQSVFDRKLTATHQWNASGSKPDPETLAELKLAGVDWENPLNPQDFAAWHQTAANAQDVIRESQTSIALETTTNGSVPVRFASFTVSRADWHPTGHHIEFPSRPPIDIEELPWEPEVPTVIARKAQHSSAPGSIEPAPEEPSIEQLESSEVRLREVLRDLQAEFYAAPVIHREQQAISVLLFASSGAQQNNVSEALNGIPYLSARIVTPDSALPEERTAAAKGRPAQQLASPVPPAAPTLRAPLADNLRRYCGGLDQANSYLAAMAESHSETMMAASALRDLAGRYSVADWSRLSPGLQTRLEHLIGDYESRLLRGAHSYDALASPVLDAMLRDMEISPTVTDSAQATCCLSWREETPAVSDQVQKIQSILTRLFAGTGPDPSGAGMSPKALLVTCDRARAQLKELLNSSSGKESAPGRVP